MNSQTLLHMFSLMVWCQEGHLVRKNPFHDSTGSYPKRKELENNNNNNNHLTAFDPGQPG